MQKLFFILLLAVVLNGGGDEGCKCPIAPPLATLLNDKKLKFIVESAVVGEIKKNFIIVQQLKFFIFVNNT